MYSAGEWEWEEDWDEALEEERRNEALEAAWQEAEAEAEPGQTLSSSSTPTAKRARAPSSSSRRTGPAIPPHDVWHEAEQKAVPKMQGPRRKYAGRQDQEAPVVQERELEGEPGPNQKKWDWQQSSKRSRDKRRAAREEAGKTLPRWSNTAGRSSGSGTGYAGAGH